ncbi:MAG: hypothetical protein EKK53_00530 [Burkholderiales bacterium]|nr:MAG: hypothetical protein EKK53_00530 [Burkholderiales bacterium]
MNTAQLSQTLLAAWRQRNRDAPWERWLLSAVIVVPAVSAAIWVEGPLGRILPAVIVVLAMLIAWMVVASNLQLQNDPAAARFVPGHVRALQHAAWVGWALCTVLVAGVLWIGLSPFLRWQTLLLGSAAAASFALWASRAWWLWLMLCIYSPLLGVFRQQLEGPLAAVYGLWVAHTDGLLVLGLLALAAVVPAVIGHGDARHRRAYARQRRMQELQRMIQEGRQATPAQTFEGLERFSRPFDVVIGAWRRHVVVTADNRRLDSLMARADVVLSGNQHWTYQLLTAAAVLLLLTLSLAAVLAFTAAAPADLLKGGAFGITIGLASMAANPTLSRPVLWQTRREQALLRLLPGMPQGAALNRAVAWLGLRHALLAMLGVTVLVLPLAAFTGPWGLLWLPLMAVPWALWSTTRPVAAMRMPTAMSTMLPIFGYYATALAGYAATERGGVPMLPLAGAVLLLSGLWGRARWRQLDGQPAALPAGRLS